FHSPLANRPPLTAFANRLSLPHPVHNCLLFRASEKLPSNHAQSSPRRDTIFRRLSFELLKRNTFLNFRSTL
ncbi:MAG: hypothetical protein WA476_14945, partial [Acidobacteriaceae bacterium]